MRKIKERNIAVYPISELGILSVFATSSRIPPATVIDGLPGDARIVDCQWNEEAKMAMLYVSSPSFALIPCGEAVPRKTIVFGKNA